MKRLTLELSTIGTWALQTVITSGVAILGFIALKSTAFGERLLDHHLQRKFAEHKNEQDKAIEALKADLAHLGDRGRRANEREFDALSGIWDAFVDAYLKTNQAIISYLSFPDLDRLAEEDLAAFLETTELTVGQRKQVSESAKKVDMYSKIMNLRQINAASAAIFDTRLLLRRNGIFVQPSLVDEFKSALDMLGSAQIERHMEFQQRSSSGSGYKESSRVLSEGEQVFNRLQSIVRTTLVRD